MKDWMKWGLIGGVWAVITVFYGLLNEQSQCGGFPILTFFDCYQDVIQPIVPYFSKLPVFIGLPILTIPYIVLIALIFSLAYSIIKKRFL